MGFKELFNKAPNHDIAIGDLVTCDCHGGLAVVIELFDVEDMEYPSMDMARIWWIRYPHHGIRERSWMHTISRLKKRWA